MDPSSKLFYKRFLDFGPGVGIKESQEKYMREKRQREFDEELRMDNVAMSDDAFNFLQNFIGDEVAKGYSPLIPEGLRDKYKREEDINKYLENMKRLKKRGLA
tara:strand:+ start:150 stop:458 length:309 start_codon:yes stop_codon:yes gene_type:complete